MEWMKYQLYHDIASKDQITKVASTMTPASKYLQAT